MHTSGTGESSHTRCSLCSIVAVWLAGAASGVGVAQETPPTTQPATQAPAIKFTAVTASAGIDFVHTVGDDTIDHAVESAGGGCGLIDYDGDGLLDVYLVNGCWKDGVSDPNLDPARRQQLATATDRLYRNRGNGTFEDVTVAAGVNRPGNGIGVIAADYDNDGDTDLYVTNDGPNFLYRNDGGGKLTEVAAQAGVADPLFSTGAAFFDYDNDKRLDLYVANFVHGEADATTSQPMSQPVTQSDHLYRANGDGTFTDVTHAAGLDALPPSRTRSVLALDFDRDGWADLLAVCAGGENRLWRNQGDGTFENVAAAAGVAAGPTEPTAIEYGDIDGDGQPDLFVGGTDGCRLYRLAERGRFEDVSGSSTLVAALGVQPAWGAVLADFDLDTNLDLLVAGPNAGPSGRLLRGAGRGVFVDVSAADGADLAPRPVGRGVARGDFDNDGDVDVLINNLNAGPVLLRNDTPRNGRHWLTLSLRGVLSNRPAIGARVRVHIGAGKYVQALHTGGSYLSQPDARLHFGLGTATRIDRVDIVWPDGMLQTVTQLPADTDVRIVQQPNHGWQTVPRK